MRPPMIIVHFRMRDEIHKTQWDTIIRALLLQLAIYKEPFIKSEKQMSQHRFVKFILWSQAIFQSPLAAVQE